jgi:hypothetical protein
LYYLWSEQNVGDMAASTEEVLMRIRDVHRETNLMRIRESSRYGYHMNILETNPDLPWYLKERLPIRIMGNIVQVRAWLFRKITLSPFLRKMVRFVT